MFPHSYSAHPPHTHSALPPHAPQSYQRPSSFQQSFATGDYHNMRQMDIEAVLENERRKAREMKERTEGELETERRQRIDLEQKCIKHQNEQQQRENLIHELDFKLNSMAQENQSLSNENYGLKEEMARLGESYQNKIQQLETNLQEQQSHFQESQFQNKQHMVQQQNDYNKQMESQQRQMDDRLQQADERILSLMGNGREQEEQNKYLQKQILQLKMSTEDEIREITNRIQQEEYQKYMMNLRTLENKLQQCEMQKDQLGRKNQELVKELQQKDHKLRTEFMDLERLNGKGQLDLQDMQNQLVQADMHLGKLRAELHSKDQLVHKMQSDYADLQTALERQKQIMKQENEDLIGQLQAEKRYDQDVKEQLNRRISEQETAMQKKDQELSRLNEEYQKLCNGLQNNINQTIYKTMNNMHYTPATSKYINKYQ